MASLRLRYWPALLSLLVLTGGAGPNDPAIPDLTPPIRLRVTSMYWDGGTVYFVLSDARGKTLHGGFDGRIRVGDDACPQHCFVGGDYPTNPGVRLLPLWGTEERKLVRILATVVSDTASPDEVQALMWYRRDIPKKLHGGIGPFIRAVEKRRRTLEAIDRGVLAGSMGPSQLFTGADTARVQSLVRDRTTHRFLVTFLDAKGNAIRIGYPTSPDSVMSPAVLAGVGYAAGTWVDRMMVTEVVTALDRARNIPVPAIDERDRSALLEILKARIAKILEADKDC